MRKLGNATEAPLASGEQRRFTHIAIAGITFQGGSAAVDSGTIMAALVFQLTGSSLAVGAVTAVLRFGWLFPQLFVGFLAERRASSSGVISSVEMSERRGPAPASVMSCPASCAATAPGAVPRIRIRP